MVLERQLAFIEKIPLEEHFDIRGIMHVDHVDI